MLRRGATLIRKCPKCDSENTDTARFCSECGTQLIPSKKVPAQHTKTIETPREEITSGSTFAGRYQIIDKLGKGGMGKVFRVLDKQINEEVAIKLIKPEIAKDKKTIEDLFNFYKQEGFSSEAAMKKAILVYNCFNCF